MLRECDVREFLPAALEIERTPPLPLARGIAWTIMTTFVAALLWAIFGRVDIVGVAHGKVVPIGRVKVVQAFDRGIVKAIHVHEGQRVAIGEPLIDLEDGKIRADLVRLLAQEKSLKSDIFALRTQLTALSGHDTSQKFNTTISIPAARLLSEISRLRIESAIQTFDASVGEIEQEIKGNRAEYATKRAQIALIDAVLPIITERTSSLAQLAQQSLAPRASWLDLEERRVGQEKERDVLRAQLQIVDASYKSLIQRRRAFAAQTRSGWLTELAKYELSLASVAQDIVKVRTMLGEAALTSPIAGTVQELKVHTIGGIVSPAEQLMSIVPSHGSLGVDAWILNKDIGFARAGQRVTIKVETFPFTKFGLIDGEIQTLSNDAIEDERSGLVYLAQVKLLNSTLRNHDKEVSLSSGMSVTVEINMGQRRLIEFLLTPLLRYRDEGLKER